MTVKFGSGTFGGAAWEIAKELAFGTISGLLS
jgi:hypothetical protein